MTATELQQLAASYAGEAIRVLVQIAQDENADKNVRSRAARSILSRAVTIPTDVLRKAFQS